jgi:hypothetical protein
LIRNLLFYCFPITGVISEFFFGLDYFLWRI